MDINEVINKGQITVEAVTDFSAIYWWWWAIGIILAIIFISSLISKNGGSAASSFFWLIVFSLLTWLGAWSTGEINAMDKQEQLTEEWKNEIAIPHINSLEKEQYPVKYFKMDPEMSHNVEGSYFIFHGYTRSTIIEKTYMLIGYKYDNQLKDMAGRYEVEFIQEGKSYIEFQHLKKDLGHGIKKGIYNIKIYLNENDFGEIQIK